MDELTVQACVCEICGVETTKEKSAPFGYMMDNSNRRYVRWKLMCVCSESCREQYVIEKGIPENLFYDEDWFVPVVHSQSNLGWWCNNEHEINIRKKAEEWLQTNKSLLLFGSVGSGKSALAVALAFEFRKREKTILYKDYPVFVDELNSNSRSGDRSFIKPYHSHSLVILDDIDSYELRPEAEALQVRIFNEWYNRNQRLIVTSNYKLANLKLDKRIVSRLVGMSNAIYMGDHDYRSMDEGNV